MPKKLTKAQVKAQYKTLMRSTSRLANDKLSHPDSKVPQSMKLLIQMANDIRNAFNRVK